METVAGPVLPLALAGAVLSLLPGPERWQLDLALWRSEPWRLLTGHLVHWSAEHLAWDLALFVGLGLACEAGGRRGTAAALALAAVAIAVLAPPLTPGLDAYRGLSGLDSALYALLATRCLGRRPPAARVAGAVALVGLGAKVAWEIVTGTALFVAAIGGVAVVPAAHLAGGLAGFLVGLSDSRHEMRSERRWS